MRLHRFYVNQPISGDGFDITDREVVHQWRSVFRYNVGSQVILFDGSGTDYLCMITSLRGTGATVGVLKKRKISNDNKKDIWLCMALIKKDNFEWVVQKTTELGVNHIVPIVCEHSEKRKLNTERMKKITVEASEQSGRGDLLEIESITNLEELFKSGKLPQEKIVLDPSGVPWKQYISGNSSVSFALFVGPEGGWSEKELNLFKSYNVPVCSIGTQVLRAETAGIVVSGLLLLS